MKIWDPTSQLLYDNRREAESMDILGIQSMDEITIVPWRPPTTPPMDASYVFVKYLDPEFDIITFDLFAYENDTYTYFYGNGGSFDLPLSQVLGWAYPVSYRK